ncbi:acetyl esterase [Dongia mobilis]|uniref:Acetyl esterase n=1 Tax=Dongia mobilis TaxID=578943 RepID=A0A4R6WND6_9PROT|nr:alpha/beta hydrolase [Dongia mobilis]TDQ80800.1 acetyl esterase [Dongia mobilis]
MSDIAATAGPADAAIAEFMAASDATFTAAFDALPIDRQRAIYDLFWQRYHAPRPAGIAVSEINIPGPAGAVRALHYRPEGAATGSLPAVAYFHGGGWSLGSPESHDIAAARLCQRAGVMVLNVDYRLSPEHRFPDALMDALAAVNWLAGEEGARQGIDPARLAVAGDSAGGNLAAALCLWLRDKGGPRLRFQALIYPALTAAPTPGGSGDMSPAAVSHYLQAYFGGQDLSANPYAMPLSAKSLVDLPPAYILTAELDPIRFHGEDYARRLRHAGITCSYTCASGLPHTFLRMLHLSSRAAGAFADLCDATKAALSYD